MGEHVRLDIGSQESSVPAEANAGQLATTGVILDSRAPEAEQLSDLAGVEQVGALERAIEPDRVPRRPC